MIKWHLETRKISSLKPHPKNPRRLTKEQHAHLRYNLNKFGMAAKPEVNIDGQIIGGHMRIKVWKELGNNEVECNVPDRLMTPEEVDEACIRFNKNTGEWDWDLLGNEWEVQDLFDWGFTADDLHLDKDEIDGEDKPKKEKECPHCGEKL
jgi:ParB-like chromosome segregation protein Spo0J